jgi:hypothetical protein
MKNLTIAVLFFVGSISWTTQAQHGAPSATEAKEKMKIFSTWIGRWQGEGSMQMGPGEPRKSNVDEHIELKLDGTILLVEGIGKAEDPATKQLSVVHHALAVLSYDQSTAQYKFKSYLKDGRSTDAWFKATGENKFQWGFDIPNGSKMRYSITLDGVKKTWNEIGEYSKDGTTWSKVFEMNLRKVE